jgi:hypothetical protein
MDDACSSFFVLFFNFDDAGQLKRKEILIRNIKHGTYVLFMRLRSEKLKITSWKKKDFEDLDDFASFF